MCTLAYDVKDLDASPHFHTTWEINSLFFLNTVYEPLKQHYDNMGLQFHFKFLPNCIPVFLIQPTPAGPETVDLNCEALN